VDMPVDGRQDEAGQQPAGQKENGTEGQPQHRRSPPNVEDHKRKRVQDASGGRDVGAGRGEAVKRITFHGGLLSEFLMLSKCYQHAAVPSNQDAAGADGRSWEGGASPESVLVPGGAA